MPDLETLRERFLARPIDDSFNLAGYDASATPFVDSKSDAKDQLENMQEQLFDAHELVFAEKEKSVLLVLQGLDCSGKNGTIKHVVIAMNPAGVRTASFKEPTDDEKAEHFLERYRRELPVAGNLGVFDRSHYEDAICPIALATMDPADVEKRIDEINTFEAELVEQGTTIVKCMLHISYDEQRQRFLRRLRRDDKRWKFSESDIETRRLWNEFQAAYSQVIGQTTTSHAPWYVIPADHKWYRNWAVGQLLLGAFEQTGAQYPQPEYDLDDLRRRLEAPF